MYIVMCRVNISHFILTKFLYKKYLDLQETRNKKQEMYK